MFYRKRIKKLEERIKFLELHNGRNDNNLKILNIWKYKQENPAKFKIGDIVSIYDIEYTPSIYNIDRGQYISNIIKNEKENNPFKVILVFFDEELNIWKYECINKVYEKFTVRENQLEKKEKK